MSLVEWYLGLPSASPGQGSDWGLESNAAWAGGLPAWLAVLLTITVIIAVVVVYLKDAASLSWPRRMGLILLRLASLVLVLIMLGRVTLTLTRTGLPTLAVLIDTSASMGLEDRYDDEEAAKSARLLTSNDGESKSRLSLAKSLLTQNDARFLAKLQETHRLKLYEFHGTATAVDVQTEDASDRRSSLTEAVRQLEATGDETRPAAAVSAGVGRSSGAIPPRPC